MTRAVGRPHLGHTSRSGNADLPTNRSRRRGGIRRDVRGMSYPSAHSTNVCGIWFRTVVTELNIMLKPLPQHPESSGPSLYKNAHPEAGVQM
jgi:hypothetical protein